MYENETNRKEYKRNGESLEEKDRERSGGSVLWELAWRVNISWTLIVTIWADAKKKMGFCEYLKKDPYGRDIKTAASGARYKRDRRQIGGKSDKPLSAFKRG